MDKKGADFQGQSSILLSMLPIPSSLCRPDNIKMLSRAAAAAAAALLVLLSLASAEAGGRGRGGARRPRGGGGQQSVAPQGNATDKAREGKRKDYKSSTPV